ncbi:MAG: tetratricopeptide repeat protein [Bacteroidia bacterium]
MLRFLTCLLLILVLGLGNLSAHNGGEDTKTKVHIFELLDYQTPDNEDDGYRMRATSKLLLQSVEPVLLDLQSKMEIEVIPHKLYDEELNETKRYCIDTLTEHIKKMDCENQVVIVLYSGHGFTFEDGAKGGVNYPNLMLNYDHSPSPYISFQDVLVAIQKKKPKMILSVVSACQEQVNKNSAVIVKEENKLHSFKWYKELGAYTTAGAGIGGLDPEIQRGKELFQLVNYQKDLFGDRMLSIELMSCSKGELTYINNKGGHFMRAFHKVFSEKMECRNTNRQINWEEIARDVEIGTKELVDAHNASATEGDKHTQTPQCRVFIKTSNDILPLRELTKPVGKTSCETVVTVPSIPVPAPSSSVLPPTIPVPTSVVIVEEDREMFYEYNKVKQRSTKITHEFAKRLTKLANTYREARCFDCAIDALNVASEALNKYGDKYYEATAYENMALVYLDRGNTATAQYYFEKAFDLFRAVNACGSATTIYKRLVQMGNTSKTLGNCKDEYESISE